MLAPTNLESTYPATKMKTLHFSPISASSPSFALISVLALVSLAALTATAFLASARLERQATMPLTQTTTLEMALNAGVNAAKEILDYAPSKHFNFVTTYWRGAGTDDWTNELGYLLNGAVRSTSTRTSTIVNYYCCFSTATMTNLGTTASATIVVSNDITSQGTFLSQMTTFMNTQTNFANGQSTNIPLLGDTSANRCTSPPVGWVYIKQDVRVKPGSTNTTNVPVARFAFYVQDLCGMIDAERMGGLTNGLPYRDSTALPATYTQGTNPAEISLTNLTGTMLANAANVSTFTSTNNRVKYLSPGMLILSNAGKLATNDLRYVTTGLRHLTNAYERIPVGLGYPRSWDIKTQLKDVNFTNLIPSAPSGPSPSTATPTTNTNFILFISNNLKQFALRSGGMNTNRYLAALGANANDYIDTDINPTTSGTGNTAVRGIEPLPLVTETATSVWWYDHGTALSGIAGVGDEFRVVNYIELWNPSDRPFNGNIGVCFSNAFGMGPPGAGGNINGVSLNLSLQTAGGAGRVVSNTIAGFIPNGTNTISVNLVANEYRVYELGTNIHRFRVGAAEPIIYGGAQATNGGTLQLAGPPNGVGAITNCRVQLFYNNTLYDQSLINRTSADGWQTARVYKLRPASPNPFYAASYPALRPYVKFSASPARPGDVRMSFYLNLTNSTVGYNSTAANPGSSLGYRNRSQSSLGGTVDYKTDYSTWLDGGHTNSPYNTASVTEANPPPIGSMPGASATNDYVQKFNNTGTWSNIFELGNIFDPMAWNVPTNSPCITTAHSLAGDGSTVLTNGGGTTLRIGRAEHQRFAWTNQGADIPNMQMSSAALLDMFCVTNQFDESGQINLNTAPAPVLRALAGRIYLRSDPALLPGRTNFSTPPVMVEAFAQGVMRFRAQYPFYSPSQLAFIGTDPSWPNTTTWPANAVFGNTNTISLTTAPGNTYGSTAKMNITEWNDQATEEWFSKIVKLSTTYSRNFRVYVIAQKATNNASGNIGVGPVVRKYYNVCTRQNSDSITNIPAASASTFNTYESSY